MTKNKSKDIVYIISDFKCSACNKAEKALQLLYDKYVDKINFQFVFFSEYIDNLEDVIIKEYQLEKNEN